MTPPMEPIAPESALAPDASAHALAMCAIDAERAPGFTLLEDAGGRFVVESEFGVVSLRDEALLEAERGQIHHARLHVLEPSGASYVLDMRLRLTGMTPQLVRDMPEDEEPAL